jgi:hypothetical protein
LNSEKIGKIWKKGKLNRTTVLAQETVIQQQNQTINNLTNKINKLEIPYVFADKKGNV